MQVNWQKLGWVEVQVFQPETPSKSAILFCPGFPGLGAAMFEQRHAAALAAEGYDVYVIHHKGTRIACGLAPSSINNGQRLQEAYDKGETHLGGSGASIHELLREPLIVLQNIASEYESIHLIGNSFGALSALWSLTEDGVPAANVKSLILFAGAQGVNDGSDTSVMRVWTAEFISLPHIADQIEVTDVPEMVATLSQLYKDLPQRVMDKLPGRIKLTYVVIEKDELLFPSDTMAFQAAIGGRGTVTMDKDECGVPAYGISAHYTPNYKTRNFLDLIRG
jgi:pimeloyl-ACP methyl ester carboxylesterase